MGRDGKGGVDGSSKTSNYVSGELGGMREIQAIDSETCVLYCRAGGTVSRVRGGGEYVWRG